MKKNLNIKIDDAEEAKEPSRSPIKTGRTTARNLALNLNAMPSTATSRYYQQKTLSLQIEPKKQEEIIVKTIVKTENNGEVFLTDAPDVDFDDLNEQKAQEIKNKFAAQ